MKSIYSEEYENILQLLKSDNDNNKILGLQLAKTLDYDLIELLDLMWIVKNSWKNMYIGDYEICDYFQNQTQSYSSLINIFHIYKHGALVDNMEIEYTKETYESIKHKMLTEFLKLLNI